MKLTDEIPEHGHHDYILLKRIADHLDIDDPLLINFAWRDGQDTIDAWLELAFKDISALRGSRQNLIITDTWEFRENSFAYLAEKLVKEGHFSKDNIWVICTTYPDREFLDHMQAWATVYHINFFFNKVYVSNRSVNPKKERTWDLVCFNHRPTLARAYMSQCLIELGYESRIAWSGNEYKYENYPTDRIIGIQVQNPVITDQDWFYQNHKIKGDEQASFSNHSIHSSVYSSMVNVVTETFVDTTDYSFDWSPQQFKNSSIFITEKTIKPILAHQIFLVQGNKGSIDYLLKMGILTFGDILDESYDREPDWKIRTKMIAEEVHRLLSLPEHKQQRILAVCQDRFVRNAKRVRELATIEGLINTRCV